MQNTKELLKIYSVKNKSSSNWENRPNPTNNVKTLFHGTHFFVGGLIVENHFKVMKAAKVGRALGNGVYFTDVGSKCAQYISKRGFSRTQDEGVILVCEVDLGNSLTLSQSNQYMRGGQWFKDGYDSVKYPKYDGKYGGMDPEWAVRDVRNIRITHIIHLERAPKR